MYGTMMNAPLTLALIIEHVNRIHGDKQIYTLLPNGNVHSYTYSDFYKRVNQLANSITALGIHIRDRVATYASNSYQHLEICCAIPYTGSIVHPLNVQLTPVQLEKIVSEADDKLIFVDGQLLESFMELQPKIDCQHVVLINMDADEDIPISRVISEYERFISKANDHYISDIKDENLSFGLCYTSGTSGEPKGVLYSHRSMFLHTLAVNQAEIFGISESDVVMPLVPMFHAFAWGLPYASMFVGADIVLSGSNREGIVDLIAEAGVTVAAGIPTVWKKLLPELHKRKKDIVTLQRLIVGGEAIQASFVETFENELGIEVRHAWGMTEMSPTGTFCTLRSEHENLSDFEKWKIKTMQGRPIPGVQIRLACDTDTDLPWDGNTIGEIQVKSPWTTSSYYKTVPTPEAFTPDGWFRTGDLATINTEGYMQIVDRAKSIIRSGGESISTVALENVLLNHHLVNNVVVIGIPSNEWGERPIAVVVLSQQIDEDCSEVLKRHLATEFPQFWIPDDFIIVDEIPKTGVGKTDKNAVFQMYARKHKP